MRAAILSVGDELVLGTGLDTNAQWLSQRLAERAIAAVEHRTVPDDRGVIAASIRQLAAVSDVLVITGGLGPTDDDLTRFALADVVDGGAELVSDQAALDHLEACFRGRGRPMPRSNLVQSLRPASSRFLPNPRGTAMGIAADVGGVPVFALPGPPHEMHAMFRDHVAPTLPDDGERVLLIRTVHEYGLGESQAARRLGELTRRDRTPQVGTTASSGIVTAHVRSQGRRRDVEAEVEALVERIAGAWKPYAFGRDGQTLAGAVVELLAGAAATVTTAESCTGGWLGKEIVDVPDASAVYRGGWVAYSNELKSSCLGVGEGLLAEHGAVSAEVAHAMARGALERAGADHALAITGVAGPSGGTPAKPVGTVFIGLAGRRDGGAVSCETRRFLFAGDRGQVRDRSVKSALQMLRLSLLGVTAASPLLGESARQDAAGALT